MEGHKCKDRFCLERQKETWLDFSLFFACVLSLRTTCNEAKKRPPLFRTALRSKIIVFVERSDLNIEWKDRTC